MLNATVSDRTYSVLRKTTVSSVRQGSFSAKARISEEIATVALVVFAGTVHVDFHAA